MPTPMTAAMETAREAGWRGRRVFVTGHTGFKGSWLTLWLSVLGAEVCGYALDPPSRPNLFQAARVGERMGELQRDRGRDMRGDVRDLDRLTAAMEAFQPEVVFHLAAQPLVRRSYAEPVATYATNVLGTVHLLEAIRRTPSVRAAVAVTTDKCYENREWHWGYREEDGLGGRDPYSSSKACAELVCAAYRASYFAPGLVPAGSAAVALATARAGNVIGGGDWAEDRLVPDLLRGFLGGEPVPIRNPHAVRPWQHVLEPLRGYLMLAERLLDPESAIGGQFASAWNFGPYEQDARPVGWIVERLAGLWPHPTRRDAGDGVPARHADYVHEANYLRLDCAKAHSQLHWRPALDLETALQWTVDWALAWAGEPGGADMQRFTLDQIAAYSRLCAPGEVPRHLHEGAVPLTLDRALERAYG